MDNLIQCEFCEIYINFDDYSEHILECFENENKSLFSSLTSSIMTSLTSSIYTDNNDDENDDDDNEDDNDDDIDDDDNIRIFTTTFNINIPRSFNFYDPYQYQNLEDVKIPVKNIDSVAPIIPFDSIPEDTYCSICQDKISTKSRKTLCNHYYCSNCLEPWLKMNKTCPSCLADLESLHKTDTNEENEENENTKENDENTENTEENDENTEENDEDDESE